MSEEQAIATANKFIQHQLGPNPHFQGERYTYELLGARFSKHQDWSVSYNLIFPDYPNRIWDGPTVVIVNPITQEASFFV